MVYFTSRYKDSTFKTCPRLYISIFIQQSLAKKNVFNSPKSNINCKSKNLIYLPTCENCGLQYVDETALTLSKAMNIHFRSKKASKYIISYFKECQKSVFSIQVVEVLEGSEYDENRN